MTKKIISITIMLAVFISTITGAMAYVAPYPSFGQVFDYATTFSGVQGGNNWHYMYADFNQNNYTEMPLYIQTDIFGTGGWKDAPGVNMHYGLIGPRYIAAGALKDPVLVFKAPIDGIISIDMIGGLMDNRTGGDGLRMNIYKESGSVRTKLFPMGTNEFYDVPFNVGQAITTPFETISNVQVKAGDMIYIRVNKGSGAMTNSHDNLFIRPQITYTEFEGVYISQDYFMLNIENGIGEQVDISYNETGTVSYHWTSSDDDVATVSQTGRITAISPGTATITLTARDDAIEWVSTAFVEVVNKINPKPFENGDVIGLWGDSITHAGRYGHDITLLYATKYPDIRINIAEFGFSGDTTRDILERIGRDFDTRPDINKAIIMLGANDVAIENNHSDSYEMRMTEIANRLKAKGIEEITIFTASPFDGIRSGNMARAKQVKDFAFDARRVASDNHCAIVDTWAELMHYDNILKEGHPVSPHMPSLIGPDDNLHPRDLGHMIMARAFLKAQGVMPLEDRQLPRISFDKKTGQFDLQEYCIINEQSNLPETLEFSYKPNYLPFPATDGYTQFGTLEDIVSELNDYSIFRVTNLPDGEYDLRINNISAGRYSPSQLAQGINLVSIEGSPLHEYSQRISNQIETIHLLDFALITNILVVETKHLGFSEVVTPAVGIAKANETLTGNALTNYINSKNNEATTRANLAMAWDFLYELVDNRNYTISLTKRMPIATHYDASEDLDGIQGKNNWYYMYTPLLSTNDYNLNDYREFNFWNQTNRYWLWNTNATGGVTESQQFGRIRNSAGEVDVRTGNIGDPSRVFEVPADGRIKISTKNLITAENNSEVDVVRFRIYHNDTIIYPNETTNPDIVDLDWLVLGKTSSYLGIDSDVFTNEFEPISLDAKEGDKIIFRTNKGSNSITNSGTDTQGKQANNNGDRLIYTPVIEYLYTGPLPPKPVVSQPRYFTDDGTEIFNLTDGVIRTRLNVTNWNASPVSATVYAVLYDNEGMIIKNLSSKYIDDITKSEDAYIDIEVSDSLESLLKIFIWQELSPLCQHFKLEPVEDMITLYTTLPDAVESTSYSVMVNGQEVFVENFLDISYARFAFSGRADVTITVNEYINSHSISPKSFNIKPIVNEKNMAFSLERPSNLIININDNEKLFVFADDIERNAPKLGNKDVYNIMDFPGIDNTGTVLNTQQIQYALDDVASKTGGGVLYFPNGKYLTGTIRIRNNTVVYLEDGALIQGTANTADYPNPLFMKDGTEAVIGTFILFDQASNSKLTGRGVVSGAGKTLRNAGNDAWLVTVIDSNDILVEDVILRDSAAFNSHICFSEHVTFRGVKIINDIDLPNTDGIIPDSSRHVVIDDVFAYCSDDTVSIKSHRYTTLIQDSYDIVVKNSVFWTRKSALKIGEETSAYNMYNIRFENNDVVYADRVIVAYVHDGGTVSNVYWVNNRAEFIGGDTFERLIDFRIRTRDYSGQTYKYMPTPGRIENVVIKDFYAEGFSANDSFLEGFDDEYQIKNIYIDNMVVGGKRIDSLAEARIVTNPYVQNIVFGSAPQLPPPPLPLPFESGIFIEKDGLVVFEAEHYNSKVSRNQFEWVLSTSKRGTLGDGSMVSNSKAGNAFNATNRGPHLNYEVNFTEAGTYYVWARTYSPNGINDRLYVGLNGSLPASTDFVRGHDNNAGWLWNNIHSNANYTTIEITEPGVHTINVYMGSKTLYFDKMFLWKTENGTDLQKFMSLGLKGKGPMESNTIK